MKKIPTVEQLAAMAAEHVNGGKFVSGDFYSPGHRAKWVEAIRMVLRARMVGLEK